MENEMNFECKEYASSCLWENRYSPEPYSFTKNILLDFIIRPHVDFKSIYLCIDSSLLSEIDNIEYHKTLYYTIKGINMFETTSYLIDKPTIAIDYINKIISSNTLKAITNCISEIVYENILSIYEQKNFNTHITKEYIQNLTSSLMDKYLK